MKVTAALATAPKAPFEIVQLSLDEPRPDEVRVKLVATGVCHTDAIVRDQVYPTPLPAVLGHEGAGIVEAVGSLVTSRRRRRLCGSFRQFLWSMRAVRDRTARRLQRLLRPQFRGYPSRRFHSLERWRVSSLLTLFRPIVVRDARKRCCPQRREGRRESSAGVARPPRLRPPDRGRCGHQLIGRTSGFQHCCLRHRRRWLRGLMAAAAVGATTIVAVDIVESRLATAKDLVPLTLSPAAPRTWQQR